MSSCTYLPSSLPLYGILRGRRSTRAFAGEIAIFAHSGMLLLSGLMMAPQERSHEAEADSVAPVPKFRCHFPAALRIT